MQGMEMLQVEGVHSVYVIPPSPKNKSRLLGKNGNIQKKQCPLLPHTPMLKYRYFDSAVFYNVVRTVSRVLL